MPLNFIWKWVGAFLIIIAIALTIVFYSQDVRLTINVFALSSYFMEHKMFTTFPTNVSDEILLLLYLIGLALIVFSKEKNETNDIRNLKYELFARASLYNTIFILLSILFIYGASFIVVLVLNFYSTFIIYLILFYRDKRRRLA